MHIVYDYQAFSLQTHGGISRYYSEIAPRIAAMPNSCCTIVAGAHRNAYVDSLGVARVGMRVPHIRALTPLRALGNALFTRAWLASHAADVVHETYYRRVRLAPTARTIVITVHDMIHERFPELFPAGDGTARRKAAAVARADAVICVSSSTRDDLLAMLPVDPEKVHVIHHGCTIRDHATRPMTGERPYLLYVGPRGGYKNWATLIAALATTPSVGAPCDLVCFGGRSFTAEEAMLIRRAVPRSIAVRHVEGDDRALASLYAGAAALVYPSLYEGFGLPPLEAMASGCPVVCSNTSSLTEVFAGAAELFNPLDAEALARALREVVLSPERRDTLRIAGFVTARRLSWDLCATRTRAAYVDACLARDRRRPGARESRAVVR